MPDHEVAIALKRHIVVPIDALGASLPVTVGGIHGELLFPTPGLPLGQPDFVNWTLSKASVGASIPGEYDPVASAQWGSSTEVSARLGAIGMRFPGEGPRPAVSNWVDRFVDWMGALVGVGVSAWRAELPRERWTPRQPEGWVTSVRMVTEASLTFMADMVEIRTIADLVSTGTELPAGRGQLLQAHTAFANGALRAAVTEAATALEIGLWGLLAAAAATCPPEFRPYLEKQLDRATLGRLTDISLSVLGDLHPDLKPSSPVIKLRNDVVHKAARVPEEAETWKLLEIAYVVLNRAEPLPGGLVAPAWTQVSS